MGLFVDKAKPYDFFKKIYYIIIQDVQKHKNILIKEKNHEK